MRVAELEVGEHHRRVQPHPLVAVGQVEELGEVRRAHVRHHHRQLRVPLEHPRRRRVAGVVVADRRVARVHDHGGAGLGEQRPRRVQRRVVEVELPHLHVHLPDLHPGGDPVGDVRRHVVLRVERRRPQRLRDVALEAGRPLVEVARDARPVGVGQGREPAHPERAQLGHPLLDAAAVADRPLAPQLRAGVVELLPHLRLHRRRQEVGVHVEQAGQAQAPPERGGALDLLLPGELPAEVGGRLSHACPSAGARPPPPPRAWRCARRSTAACPTTSCRGPGRSRPWRGRP